MVCYLCPFIHGECPGCQYVNARMAPKFVIPSWIIDTMCVSATLPCTTKAAELHFIDNAVFRDIHETREKRVSTGQAALDAFGRASKRRRVHNKQKEIERQGAVYPDGVIRLVRFQKLVALLGTVEFANNRFELHEEIMRIWTITHLYAIVGIENLKECGAQLRAMLCIPGENIAHVRHTILVTSRQQGKSLLYAKLVAALLMLSPLGDSIDMYATNLQKSQNIMRVAGKYINECRNNPRIRDGIAALGMKPPVYTTYNSRVVVLKSCIDEGVFNTFFSFSNDVINNRGNNGRVIGGDEGAWLGDKCLNVMLMPLLAVPNRTMTLLTTPPEAFNPFNNFLQKIKDEGRTSAFTIINHVHLCDECVAKKIVLCCHRLWVTPEHKSVLGTELISRALPDGSAQIIENELYGHISEGTAPYFSEDVLKMCFDAEEIAVPKFPERINIMVFIDLPSHVRSYAGITAFAQLASGPTIILGTSEFEGARSGSSDIYANYIVFITYILQHPVFRNISRSRICLIPAPEANNNGAISKDILRESKLLAQREGIHYFNPYYKEFINKDVMDDEGIRTTDVNKLEGCVELVKAMMMRQIVFLKDMVTIRAIHIPSSKKPTPAEAKHNLRTQLKHIRDDRHGKISGKDSGSRDDQAISLFCGYFWFIQALNVLSRSTELRI